MRFFILILFFFFFINSALLAQGYYQQISFAQVDDFENDSENTELEDFDPEGLDEKEEINLNDTESQKKVLNSMYFSFDIGIPITFFPHRSLWGAYRDSDYHFNSPRAAASFTVDRFRFESGYLKANFEEGDPDIDTYDGKQITDSSSKMSLDQHEVLFFWLRNDPHRISFIGGGYIYLTVNEEFTMDYVSNNQSHSITRKETDKVRGYKLIVGGQDTDSLLKTSFSYTSAFIETKIGKRYDLGGFAFTFSLSFNSL
ncbi:MAG: hypothetical protein HOD92_19480 [Deltaproteobacteria bacterium]|mgnify:CR=1 FL=1|jgi:hypothetical protein|nr:hypothetical protein [Deltaproteobacteria bacterium]MBT4526546.1 hypothetical protein [Deltaproteobacteria bacterium]